MKGRLFINGRDVGTASIELCSLPGNYWDIKIGNEFFRHCYMCEGRGRRRLRKRSRGRGPSGRYGPCPSCEGRGGRWQRFDLDQTVGFTIDEVDRIDPEVLKLFFNGSSKNST